MLLLQLVKNDYALKMKEYQTCNFLNPMIWDTNLVTQPEFLEQPFSSYYHCPGNMYDLQVALLLYCSQCWCYGAIALCESERKKSQTGSVSEILVSHMDERDRCIAVNSPPCI